MATLQKPIGSGFGAASTAADVIKGIDLSGKTAIVTSGHSGIGLETTRALRSAGAKVIVLARDRDKAADALHGLDVCKPGLGRILAQPPQHLGLNIVRVDLAGGPHAFGKLHREVALAAADIRHHRAGLDSELVQHLPGVLPPIPLRPGVLGAGTSWARKEAD